MNDFIDPDPDPDPDLEPEVTELAEIHPTRIDVVEKASSGFPFLMLKSVAPSGA